MNAERLRYLAEWLLDQETTATIQRRLNEVVSSLENLASNPQDSAVQSTLDAKISELDKVVSAEFYDV
jgi:flagellar hook-associated protein FlgK